MHRESPVPVKVSVRRSWKFGLAVCLTARFLLVAAFAIAFPCNIGLQ